MLDFKKLLVYQKHKKLNLEIFQFLKRNDQIDLFLQDQLKRASTSVLLNIAEGAGRLSAKDKQRFYTISRGSVFEVSSILDIMKDLYFHESNIFGAYQKEIEEISNMLTGLIKSTSSLKISKY